MRSNYSSTCAPGNSNTATGGLATRMSCPRPIATSFPRDAPPLTSRQPSTDTRETKQRGATLPPSRRVREPKIRPATGAPHSPSRHGLRPCRRRCSWDMATPKRWGSMNTLTTPHGCLPTADPSPWPSPASSGIPMCTSAEPSGSPLYKTTRGRQASTGRIRFISWRAIPISVRTATTTLESKGGRRVLRSKFWCRCVLNRSRSSLSESLSSITPTRALQISTSYLSKRSRWTKRSKSQLLRSSAIRIYLFFCLTGKAS
mmetsp:Transcript_4298/g.6359  ORF Transcript_4298/g.6359 Transcript_4298/m.6359 type:complete len:259 (+) Transcript_4298:27-803(+)